MIKVLDFGHVELKQSWGSDEDIIRAARQSTDGAFRGWGPFICLDCSGLECKRCKGTGEMPGDEKLLGYLYTHNHMTPFEMAGATFEIKAPIMVFREWHRHRTQSYNEMSARYIPIPDENYIPSVERLMAQGGTNKQAQGIGTALTEDGAREFQRELGKAYRQDQILYETALASGIPKELARLVLPVGRYSKMWASANLRNWMQFLTLRNAPDAQWEIQEYARVVQALLKEKFPRVIALFEEGR